MTTYCTVAELNSSMGIPDGQNDPEMDRAINAACRWIDKLCGRRFYSDSAVSARIYRPDSASCVKVDDFSTTTGLIIKTDAGDDLTYEQTWSSSDYELHPLNGLGPAGQSWPYNEIVAASTLTFPSTYRACVQVTALWGWAAVPADIKLAAIQLSQFCFQHKDAALGIAAVTDIGALRARVPSIVTDLLAGFERETAYGAPMIG